jgi:hypothetical protein
MIAIEVMVELAGDDLERFGLKVAAKATRDVLRAIKGEMPINNLGTYITIARQSLMQELESRVFVPIAPDYARFYREPKRDWDEVIERFPDTISDIEEAGKCYALARYAASVFHSMQIMEHGLLALGVFMQVADPKSGFTAVANALQKIKNTKYTGLSEFERNYFAFFEQMNASVQAVKDAWRNKVNHAQGKLILMTTDFSPAVAIEIYMATRAFMRRLATELPK